MANRKKGGGTVEAVWDLCEPIVKSLGLELWDVRYLKEGAQWYLRVYIDRPEGVTIEDCENVSRAIDEPLDRLDPVDQSYCLEVCSPGLERELIRPEHFQRFEGWPVMVKLIRPLDSGEREFTGVLGTYENGMFDLWVNETDVISLAKKDTVFVKLDDFDDDFGGAEE